MGWGSSLLVLLSTTVAQAESKPTELGPAKGAGTVVPIPVAAPSATPLTGVAAAFQRSYDEEGAGRLEAARKALDDLPSPQRESYVAEYRRGWLLFRLGRNVDSIASYERAIALEPSSVEARLGALAADLGAKRWKEARKMAKAVLKRDPGNYTANIKLAYMGYSAGKMKEAEKLYRKVLSLYPSDTDARNGLAWTLLKLGKRDDARQIFRDVLEVVPRSPLALEGLKASKGGG